MARKPITTAHMEPSIDRSNMIAIQKRFTSEAWDELVNSSITVSNKKFTFILPITWQEIKSNYAEVYFCVKGKDDLQHTVIIPTDMINKVNSTARYNLTPNNGVFMYVTLGQTDQGTVDVSSTEISLTRLIILSR